MIEAQALDHLQGNQVTLQNFDLGVEFGGVKVIESYSAAAVHAGEAGVHFINGQSSAGVVDRGHAEAGDGDDRENRQETCGDRPLMLAEDAELLPQCGALRRGLGIEVRVQGPSELNICSGLHFTNNGAAGLKAEIHGRSSTNL